MPEIYTELTAPTAITHSLYLPFTSANAENIVVAKTSLLQIFTVTTHDTQLSNPLVSSKDGTEVDRRVQDGDDEQGGFVADLALQKSQVEAATKLVLIAEYNVYGSIAGLQHIKTLSSKSGGDALLVSFRNAKVSLLEWDPETAAVSTISLHYYERDEFISPVVDENLPTILVADPTSRCAALKFAGDMLAILPFRRRDDEDLELGDADAVENKDPMILDEADDDDWDPAAPDGKPALNGTRTSKDSKPKVIVSSNFDKPYNPSFVVSAAQLDDQIQHIISLAFLHEYREPTFGILYAPRRTWTGLLAAEGRKDNTAYIVITLDLEQKASTPILGVSGLPYDIQQVIPLTPPIGGSLLIGGTEIIHVDQAGKTTGVGVNPYAKKSTGFPLADQSELCLALEGSTLINLEGENGDLLLITKDGTGVIVSFKLDGRNVSGVKVSKMMNHPKSLVGGRATTAVALGGKKLFIGCSEGDGQVMKWRRKAEKRKVSIAGLEDDTLDATEMEEIYGMLDDVDDDLYSGNNESATRKDSIFATGNRGSEVYTKGEYVFQTHDRLVNLGPFRDMDLGIPVVSPGSEDRQRGVVSELEVVTTSGPTVTSEDAGLSLIRRSIAPSVVGRFDFAQCKALWTVRAQGSKTGKSETGVGVGEELERSVDEEFDRYLFVSKTDESQVFRVGDTFEEVRGSDFDSDGETIEVGVVGAGSRIVQVVSEQVRVYDRGSCTPRERCFCLVVWRCSIEYKSCFSQTLRVVRIL
jgi:cleavage and polyadenylation specificity factor subunit 1